MRSVHDISLPRRSLLARGMAGSAALALGGGLAPLVVGAANPFAGYPPRNPQIAGERATLTLWLLPELAHQPAYRQAIRLFEHMYPTIQVGVTPIARDDIPTRLKIAVAGNGGVPDLVSHHAYIFGAQGLAHESDALWDAWGQQGAFLPAAMRDVQWRNDKFGIPLAGNAVLAIVNAGMFERARVPLPTGRTTFGQFVAAARKVKKANGTPFAMLLSADPATVTAVVHANGGALFQRVAGRNVARLDDRRVIDAVRFYTEVGWKQRLAPLPSTGPTNPAYLAELFTAGQAPVFFGTTGDLALIKAAAGAWRVALAPLPGGTTGRTAGSVNNGVSLFIPAPSHRPHAAFELAKWLVAEPPALAIAENLRLAPTVARYYTNRFFQRDALTHTYFTATQIATPIGLDAYTEAFDLYKGALRAAFGGGDAARLLTAIQRPAQDSMDKADAGIESDG